MASVGGRPGFAPFVPAEDLDQDGVPNVADAFPTDPAAAADGDGDGSPDAWHPGMGPGDSTTGLFLDAFPGDFACQLASHGVGGICDFELVLPSDLGAPLCDVDDLAGIPAEGVLVTPPASDFVPLCSGWVLYAERGEYRVVARELVSGRIGLVAPLPSTPGDLELDAEAGTLYVAQPDDDWVAAVELRTGAVERFEVPNNSVRLGLGRDGDLWITSGSLSLVRLHLLPGAGSAVEGNWEIVGLHVQFDDLRDGLISMEDRPYAMLRRYWWDPVVGPVWLETRVGRPREGNALALSQDGQHLAVAGEESAGARFVSDYAPWDLDVLQGSWQMNEMPQAVAFDRPGARLIAGSPSKVSVFDVSSFGLLDELTVAPCSYGAIRQVGFSRGGGLALAKQECGNGHTSSTFHWLRVD